VISSGAGRFTLRATEGAARRGTLSLAHGDVETPAFMPVGTAATIKGLTPDDLRAFGTQIVLANTYHLWLRPGRETIEALGGLHAFMCWDRNILTDSGGFQVFSLESRRELSEHGVRFRSHLDGSEHEFTPENVVAFQEDVGVDVAMTLDVCVKLPAPAGEIDQAVRLTSAWAQRCAAARRRPETASTNAPASAARANSSRSNCRATRSAGFPSARRARSCTASRASPRRFCPRTSHAI